MTDNDKKISYYKDEYVGAPLNEYIGFRCTKPKEAIGLHLGPVTNTAAFDFDA